MHTKFKNNYTVAAITDDMIASLSQKYNISANSRIGNCWLVAYVAFGEANEAWSKTYRPGARSGRSIQRSLDADAHARALDRLQRQLHAALLRRRPAE